jgi:hypothetical protein
MAKTTTKNNNMRALFCTSILVFIFSFFPDKLAAHFGARGPYGGTVSCMTTYDSLVFFGTDNGGVFESTSNTLVAWRARPVGLTSGKITALTHSGKYLFAGTADHGVFIFDGYVGSDRYWRKVNSGLNNLKIKSLIAIDSITILAGTDGDGLYKTTNKGLTWVKINAGSIDNSVVTGMAKAGGRIFLIAQNQGAFISDDLGASWADFNDVNTLNIAGTNILSYNQVSGELVIVNGNGVFLAANAAAAGTATYSSVTANLPSNTAVRAVSNNGSSWYLATEKGVFVSPSGIISWTSVNTGLPGSDITAIIAMQNSLIAGVRSEGIFQATAGVHSWVANNTSFNNTVTNTMVTSGTDLVIAATPKGVHVSKNLATNYTMANKGLTDSANINDIIVADSYLLAATKNAGVFFTTDTGKNWTAINTGLKNLDVIRLFYANNRKYAIDIAGNVYQSDLHASTWAGIQAGLPSGVKPVSMAYYGGRVVLGTLGAGVFIKDDKTDIWTAYNNGLSNLNITSVTASRNKLFAGTDGNGVFIADAGVMSWTATSATSIAHTSLMGLDGSKIQAMASYAGYVYASYKGGLLTTSDNGVTWIAGGNQFNLPSFTDVSKITFVTTRVYVSTENNGIYSNALSELAALPDFVDVSQVLVNSQGKKDTIAISVSSNTGWKITHIPSWVNVSTDSAFRDDVFNILVSENNAGNRSDSIVLRAGTARKTIYINQSGALSIPENNIMGVFLSVYPNPSNGDVTIDATAGGIILQKVCTYDVWGKLIGEISLQDNCSVASIHLDYYPGIYSLRIYSDKGMITKKIIIQ